MVSSGSGADLGPKSTMSGRILKSVPGQFGSADLFSIHFVFLGREAFRPQAWFAWFRPVRGPIWAPNRRYPAGSLKSVRALLAQPIYFPPIV